MRENKGNENGEENREGNEMKGIWLEMVLPYFFKKGTPLRGLTPKLFKAPIASSTLPRLPLRRQPTSTVVSVRSSLTIFSSFLHFVLFPISFLIPFILSYLQQLLFEENREEKGERIMF